MPERAVPMREGGVDDGKCVPGTEMSGVKRRGEEHEHLNSQNQNGVDNGGSRRGKRVHESTKRRQRDGEGGQMWVYHWNPASVGRTAGVRRDERGGEERQRQDRRREERRNERRRGEEKRTGKRAAGGHEC